MSPLVRRLAVVLLLTLAAAVAATSLRVERQITPASPSLAALAPAGWRVDGVAPGDGYQQAVLVDAAGDEALLYVGTTPRIQTALRWSGELGFLGEGYLVTGRRDASVTVAGRPAPVAEARLERLGDRVLVRSAIVGPHGVARSGRDLLWGAAWDLARGQPSTYYLVRVTTAADDRGAGDRAGEVLAAALTRLSS